MGGCFRDVKNGGTLLEVAEKWRFSGALSVILLALPDFVSNGGWNRRPFTDPEAPMFRLISGDTQWCRWRCFLSVCLLILAFQISTPAQSADLQPLKQDQKLEREIPAGAVHAFRFEAAADTYILVEVEQKSIDVKLTLFDSEGKEIVSEDSPHGNQIPESFELILPRPGQYRLEITHAKPGLKPGNYFLNVLALRPALQTDRDWLRATECFNQAIYLRARNTSESLRQAIVKLEDAAKFYRSAGRLPQQANAVESIGVVRNSLGDPFGAIEQYHQALAIFREARSP
jgi:tetratricopeptide (TPR) repeat protein